MRLSFGGALLTMALVQLAACASSRIKIGEDDSGTMRVDAGGADSQVEDSGTIPCGDNVCSEGEYCCNESCGTCASEGEGCTTIACVDPVVCGGMECPGPAAACCPGCEPGASFCSGPMGECPDIACPQPSCGPDECEFSEVCCPGCGPGEGTCVPAGECVPQPCPPPQLCDGTCGDGEICCPLCDGEPGRCFPGPSCPDVDLLCPITPPCAPMRAQGEGACLLSLGVIWNGRGCEFIGGCNCIGADCDATYDSVEQCEAEHLGCIGCASDLECAPDSYCDGCAHGSCPACDDCVQDCAPHGCPTEPEATCRAARPSCGDDGVAVVRDGCWECVNRQTCMPTAMML